jgi:predicted MFS family arabinose efflux permease
VMSTRVLHLDPTHLGVLFGGCGAGTVLGGLALASLGDSPRKGRIVLASALAWAIALTGFAMGRSFAPSLAALLCVGACQVGVSATSITLLQTRVPRSMSGRVMSLNTLLIMGVRPLGDFFASPVIGRLGPSRTAIASAGLVALVALGVAMRREVRAS